MRQDAIGRYGKTQAACPRRSGRAKGRLMELVTSKARKESKPRQRASPRLGSKMRLSPEVKSKALEAAGYGMPIERIALLCGFPNSETQWNRWINANPDFKLELEQARAEGELALQRRVASADTGWQAAGWMLERTRGYVARAQLEHTGKGGKDLSISGALLGAFGNTK